MILGHQAPESPLRELATRFVSYILAREAQIEPAWILKQLADQFPATRVLVEGGGIVSGAFLEAGLVDEISLLMVPALDGWHEVRNLFDTGAQSDSRLG
jgi:riboflavin biosynthesis pyrimidine reductase